MNLKSGKTSPLTKDPSVSEIVWLGDGTDVLYVNSTNADVKGGVELWVSNTKDFSKA